MFNHFFNNISGSAQWVWSVSVDAAFISCMLSLFIVLILFFRHKCALKLIRPAFALNISAAKLLDLLYISLFYFILVISSAVKQQ